MRYLYSALLYCLMPMVVMHMLWRSRRAPAYRKRLGERLGFYPATVTATDGPGIWIHAVSVGEVAAVVPLIERLLTDYPRSRVFVTTTTPTGSARVQALLGDRVIHVYCPWDLPGAVQRFLRWAQPDLLLLVETELWPNLLYYSRQAGCRTVLVNGRLSRRSASRYARVPLFSRWLLTQLDVLVCQSQDDSEHFLSLGVPQERLLVSGNLKWECELDEVTRVRGEQLRTLATESAGPVLLAASTHPGEESLVLDAFAQTSELHPGCRLVLAPRHPERAREVAALCAAKGLRVHRLSQGARSLEEGELLLVDTIGDLPALYAAATVAFIGGSLVPVGGHNPVEAALWGIPLVSGPHRFNFDTVTAALEAAGAMRVVRDEQQLAATLSELIPTPQQRAVMGEAARSVVAANRGALERVLAVIAGQLHTARG